MSLELDLAYESGREATRPPPAVETTVYRLAQEALTNAVKHAGAARVMVRVVEADGRIDIEVRDDGAGFDPEASVEGFGLVGMRERVSLAGGTFTVRSAPGTGTLVRCGIPVTRPGQPLRSVKLAR